MNRKLLEQLEDCPVIAAVKDEDGLNACLESEIGIVFVLYGDICTISEITVNFIHTNTKADGIISTKPALIRQARELGMFTVMRFFAIDSMAFDNIRRQSEAVRPDVIEVLPGLMPRVIKRICQESRIPVIAGGLITEREDIMAALNAGAISISTTNRKVWFM